MRIITFTPFKLNIKDCTQRISFEREQLYFHNYDSSRNLGFQLNSNVGMTDSPLALDFDATSIDAARELREASRNPARRRAVWAHDVAGKLGAWACALLMQLLCQDEDAEVKATASAALANLVASEEGDGFCTLLSEICFGEAFKGVILAAVEQASESHSASRAISIFFQNLLFTVPSFACECVSVGAANHIGRITCAAAGYTAGFSELHSLDVSSCPSSCSGGCRIVWPTLRVLVPLLMPSHRKLRFRSNRIPVLLHERRCGRGCNRVRSSAFS